MTSAAERVFVDTNVLVYSSVQSAPWHADAVDRLATLRRDGTELWISRQVLREYAATLSRSQTFSQPLAADELVRDIKYFASVFQVADDDAVVMDGLLRLLESISIGGKHVHDANLVATMQVHSIPKLLTNNTSDFVRFSSLITVIPLVP